MALYKQHATTYTPELTQKTRACSTRKRILLKNRELEMDAGDASESKEHFVLVHGAGHGAWCWFRLLPLLRGSGHRVSCVDLAGAAGSRVDPGTVRSFDEYTAPLVDLLAALPDGEKVILVGHSAGGLSVTHAMHLFSDRIKQAIFIAATMLPFGYQTEQDIKDGVPDLSEHGDVFDLTFSLGLDHPPTSVALRPEFQRRILYQQSPQEDCALASIMLRPWPVALSAARFGSDSSGGSTIDEVRRVYITTAKDCMVNSEQQEAMIRRWPPSEVLAMDTDHSPYFSAPEQLFQLILKSLGPFCSYHVLQSRQEDNEERKRKHSKGTQI